MTKFAVVGAFYGSELIDYDTIASGESREAAEAALEEYLSDDDAVMYDFYLIEEML